MTAKRLFLALAVAFALWFWWAVPLKGLRQGTEAAMLREQDAERAELTAGTGLTMAVQDAQDVIDQYQEILQWVGDPITQSNEADFIDVCPMMKEWLSEIVGEIGYYTCGVSHAQPAEGHARILPIGLRLRSPADGFESPAEKAERLVLTVEENPAMLLLAFTVGEDDPTRSDSEGNLITPSMDADLTVHFYVKAIPPEDEMAAAEQAAADRAAALDSGAMLEDLLEREPHENQP